MVVVAEATLDANAVPALIIMGVMILYAGVGLVWHTRRELAPLMLAIGYAAQAGLLAGLGAGVLTAVGLEILLIALTPTGLDPGTFPVAIVEIGAAFGLGLGALIFFRRQRRGDLPGLPLPRRRLIAPVISFVWILLLLILFAGIGADATLIGLSLLGGVMSGWGLGAMPPATAPAESPPPTLPAESGRQVIRVAGIALLLSGIIVGLLPLWSPLVGIPVK